MRAVWLIAALVACTGDTTTKDTTETGTTMTGDTGTTGGTKATVSLAKDVVPIIDRECGFCHTRTDSPNPMAVANKVYLEEGGDLLGLVGTFIVAGDSSKSGFIGVLDQSVSVGVGPTVMPPPASGRKAMSKKDVAVVATWIDEGALDN